MTQSCNTSRQTLSTFNRAVAKTPAWTSGAFQRREGSNVTRISARARSSERTCSNSNSRSCWRLRRDITCCSRCFKACSELARMEAKGRDNLHSFNLAFTNASFAGMMSFSFTFMPQFAKDNTRQCWRPFKDKPLASHLNHWTKSKADVT